MTISDRGFLDRLNLARMELKAPKGQYSDYGEYSYRSMEDILEAVKPINMKYHLQLEITDDIVQVGDRYYVRAHIMIKDLLDSGEFVETFGWAREAQQKPKMDESQTTGSASSYARKYAMNALYLIDDNKDADTDNRKREEMKAEQEYQREHEEFMRGAQKEIDEFKQYLVQNDGNIASLENWIATQEGYNRIEQVPFERLYARWKELKARKRLQLQEQAKNREKIYKEQQQNAFGNGATQSTQNTQGEQTTLMQGNTTTPIDWGN